MTAYTAGKLLVRLPLGCATRVHVIRRENTNRSGGFLLAANHISHFDPFIISTVVRRKIDWMTMAEFFHPAAMGYVLRAIDAFPVDRDRANRKSIRTTIERLKEGRIVGLFPEGGIRDGVRSLLEGAPLRPGASTLAHIAGVPILPCVIVGSDRLYSTRRWLPAAGGRTPIWIAFGDPISPASELGKSGVRARIESELAFSFNNLYAELRQKYQLTPNDLPHAPRERMAGEVVEKHPVRLTARPPSGNRNGEARPNGFHRVKAKGIDAFLCASLNLLHTRHRLDGSSRTEMARYVAECERITPDEYYAPPQDNELGKSLERGCRTLTWRSPVETRFPANNFARADFFPAHSRRTSPTVFILHALMSTSDKGYRRCAEQFNKLGWNACLVHLPYHYSRVPKGY